MQETVWQKPCMTNVNGQVYQYRQGEKRSYCKPLETDTPKAK